MPDFDLTTSRTATYGWKLNLMMLRQNRWIQASRPLSQINIAIPLMVGEALAYHQHAKFSWENAFWVHGFGILCQLFIVYSNDWLDFEADSSHSAPTLISGGSRVLQDGKLRTQHLIVATACTGFVMLVLALYRLFGPFQDSWLLVATLATFALTWAYSGHPIRMSYRGSGQWLQMIGIGFVLPATGFVGQCGQLNGLFHPVLLLCVAAGYCGNLLTALPDYKADKAVGKQSPAVILGPQRTKVRLLVITTVSLVSVPAYCSSIRTARLGSSIICCWLVAAALLLWAFYLYRNNSTDRPGQDLRFSLSIASVFNTLLIGSSLCLCSADHPQNRFSEVTSSCLSSHTIHGSRIDGCPSITSWQPTVC